MILCELLKSIAVQDERAGAIHIKGLSLDSRKVNDGEIFIALSGSRKHGMTFAEEAISRGAVAVLFDDWSGVLPSGTPCIPVAGLRSAVGKLAMEFMGQPANNLQVIGVTGTNGKTTCVHLTSQLIESCDQPAAQIGTLGLAIGQKKLAESDCTTPDAVTLAKFFHTIKKREVKAVAIEVSSHALVQARISGIPFTTGIFTNLSRDHLDYHETMEDYFAAKKLLFEQFPLKAAVINIDDSYGMRLASEVKIPDLITFGWHPSAKARIVSMTAFKRRTEVVLEYCGRIFDCSVPLLGQFNAENAIASAFAVQREMGLDLAVIFRHLKQLIAAPGRMECFESSGLPTCVLDYAHTPDALEKALAAVRLHTEGAVWVVFGCGGDRDVGKRSIMGAKASLLADHVILTSDNPRSENPHSIVNQIVQGMDRDPILVNLDRAEAIEKAVNSASSQDIILIAGKGHEQTQTIGKNEIFFSDRAVIAKYYDLQKSRRSHAS